MNIPTQEGRYIASPRKWGVIEQGEHKLPTFAVEFDLVQFWNGSEWTDISQDALEITGWFYLIKKDGQPNQRTINSVMEAFGWDGRTISGLNDGEFSGTEVQLTLESEVYNNKPRMKVAWLNPRDYEGGAGVTKADPQTIQSLDAKYGAMLRAVNKPAAKPTNGAAKPPVAMNNPVELAKKAAWAEFVAKWTNYIKDNPADANDRNDRWKAAVDEHFGGPTDQKTLKAEQWNELAQALEKDWTPTVGFIPY